MNQIPKAVFSNQGWAALKAAGPTAALREGGADAGPQHSAQRQPGAESWTEAYVAAGDLAAEARSSQGAGRQTDHRARPGARRFARSLIAAGLVDQYVLLVHPIALGKGLSIFSGLATPGRLKLVSSRRFPAGTVAQIYRPA